MELSTGTKNLVKFIIEDWKLLLFLTIIFLLYFYYTSTHDFFEKRGIKFMKPRFLVGNLGGRLLGMKSLHDFQLEIYNYFKGQPYGGIFEGRRPILYLIDSEIIKAVTIRDFDHFTDRSGFRSREPRYLSRSILNLKGAEWKAVRSIMTPTFSSSRLKNLIPLLQTCADQLVGFLNQFDKKDIEMKDIMGHFTLEVIGASAFGIRSDALTDENAKFVKVAEKVGDMSMPKRMLIFFVLIFMPTFIRFFNLSFLNREVVEKLNDMLQVTKAQRRASKEKHNDFLQLLMDAAEKEKEQLGNNHSEMHLDDGTVDAQSIIFLVAGFETSSTLLSFAAHVLATKPDLQDKLREHVISVTEGKEMNYDLLTQLDYLEGFLLETLRMYPPASRIDRVVTKPYVLPGTSIKLNVGQAVAIPIYGIHMDPNIYPEPHEFRPERFMKDEKKDRPSHLFLAFGAGPRNCIGLRFAMISAKLAMVAVLKNFRFKTCPKTQDPVQFDKRAFLLKASQGIYVNVEKI
ncbi:cytochrome P450 9e2-like isoform X1 [Colias croceus]|uniref:cytochrome P450 9e2-like isoform X1 n=2 Tax=Colias crocea TaxID=72248 RepID=UPI001E27DA53|nr:cytochrome P450 9e2-like isoform X1 [Colias croceus]